MQQVVGPEAHSGCVAETEFAEFLAKFANDKRRRRKPFSSIQILQKHMLHSGSSFGRETQLSRCASYIDRKFNSICEFQFQKPSYRQGTCTNERKSLYQSSGFVGVQLVDIALNKCICVRINHALLASDEFFQGLCFRSAQRQAIWVQSPATRFEIWNFYNLREIGRRTIYQQTVGPAVFAFNRHHTLCIALRKQGFPCRIRVRYRIGSWRLWHSSHGNSVRSRRMDRKRAFRWRN